MIFFIDLPDFTGAVALRLSPDAAGERCRLRCVIVTAEFAAAADATAAAAADAASIGTVAVLLLLLYHCSLVLQGLVMVSVPPLETSTSAKMFGV